MNFAFVGEYDDDEVVSSSSSLNRSCQVHVKGVSRSCHVQTGKEETNHILTIHGDRDKHKGCIIVGAEVD